jgi:hypothetical protein
VAAVAAGTNIQLPGSTPQPSGAAAVLPAVAVLSGVGEGTSQMPVILPEKLVRNKVRAAGIYTLALQPTALPALYLLSGHSPFTPLRQGVDDAAVTLVS